ncbi:pyridoxamine 5'-phosphate oxidase family protein [Pseudochryseolinea flava]|uniref:General stress protein n=1 Tax=Pseudochryseolinea flava TaxID=2059302 RepID=A0A364Y071_9BACT|nr:pyridoxamine 5'-phosphate oxidase family protein [Pseudochryseolinea flava]RAV99286.1 general stress protein [Pseudochryseolinea flava]
MGTTKDLTSTKGIEKLREIANDAKICHLATGLDKRPISARPMSTLEVDDSGAIWFFSSISSGKNDEIEADPDVQLFYAQNSKSEYLSVFGHAEIVHDRQKIEALWTPIAKVWFTEGKNDPDISLIKVTPVDAHYWDTKSNKAVQLIKMFAGAITGKTMDDGVEGDIRL